LATSRVVPSIRSQQLDDEAVGCLVRRIAVQQLVGDRTGPVGVAHRLCPTSCDHRNALPTAAEVLAGSGEPIVVHVVGEQFVPPHVQDNLDRTRNLGLAVCVARPIHRPAQ
jgi:hypothetical protein